MKKDVRNLLLYILLLCLSAPAVGYILVNSLLSPTADAIFEALSLKYGFIVNLIYALSLFCFITLFAFPMAVTKIALDKNWSKYLNHYFDNMRYLTIVLICYILFKMLFKIEDYLGSFLSIFDYAIYPAYFTGLLRKFIKPLYKYFWTFYFFCMIIFTLMFTNPVLNKV